MYSSSFSRSTKEEQHRDPSTNKPESSGLPTGSFDTSELLESLSGAPCNFLPEQIQEVSRALYDDTDLLGSDDLDKRLNLIAMALLQHGEGVSSEDRALALVSLLKRAFTLASGPESETPQDLLARLRQVEIVNEVVGIASCALLAMHGPVNAFSDLFSHLESVDGEIARAVAMYAAGDTDREVQDIARSWEVARVDLHPSLIAYADDKVREQLRALFVGRDAIHVTMGGGGLTEALGNLEGLPVDVAVPILFVVSELVDGGMRDFAVAQIEKLSPNVASLLRESNSSALGRYLPAECKV